MSVVYFENLNSILILIPTVLGNGAIRETAGYNFSKVQLFPKVSCESLEKGEYVYLNGRSIRDVFRTM